MIRPGMRVRLKSLPYSSHGLVIRTVHEIGGRYAIVRWMFAMEPQPQWSHHNVIYAFDELEVQ